MDNLKPNFIQGAVLFFEYTSRYQYQSIKLPQIFHCNEYGDYRLSGNVHIPYFQNHVTVTFFVTVFFIKRFYYYFLLDFQHLKKCACLMFVDSLWKEIRHQWASAILRGSVLRVLELRFTGILCSDFEFQKFFATYFRFLQGYQIQIFQWLIDSFSNSSFGFGY